MEEISLTDEAEEFLDRLEQKKHIFIERENRKNGYLETHSYFN
jgi:hypothetical protein